MKTLLHLIKQSFTLLLFLSSSLLYAQQRPVGINLNSVTDYSTELVFTDAFKQARGWISHDAVDNGAWSSGVVVPLMENGFPLEIPYNNGTDPAQHVRTLLLWGLDDNTPTGNYRLIVKGEGEISLNVNNTTKQYTCPVDTLVAVNAGSIILDIKSSMAQNPISDIKFIYPEYTETYQTQTFRDDFLDFVNDFQTLRFMDWLRTNNNELSEWANRTPKNYYSQSQSNGVAWEYIIELCNTTGKNAWITIPHRATDDFIRNVAQMFKNDLDPTLKIYVEYSNELWNGQFQQNADAADFAEAMGYTGERWELTWQYTAKRSADIFRIFEEEFVDKKRLVKVIPSQAANSWLSNQLITYFKDPKYNPTGVTADALAIAPYFAGSVANKIVEDGLVQSITLDEIILRMEASFEKSFGWIDANMEVANTHGLKLTAYEGGQHLVATGSNVDNEMLTEKLIAANRHADMEELYCTYFDYWYATAEADLFCVFASHGTPSKWGSWGIKINMEDVNAPKYLGVKKCIVSHNDVVASSTEFEETNSLTINPNPSANGVFNVHAKEKILAAYVTDVLGHVKPIGNQQIEHDKIRLKLDKSGLYLITVFTESQKESVKVLVE